MSKFAFVFVLWILCVNADTEEVDDKTIAIQDKARNTFADLLSSIIKINEQRVATMKRLTSLQDINVALDALRHGQDDDSAEALDAMLIIFVSNVNTSINLPEQQITAEIESNDTNETISTYEQVEEVPSVRCDSSISDSSENKDVSRSAWKSCRNAGAKMCNKACVESHKTTCAEFSCSKRMKKMLKKECKKACKRRFS